MHSTRKNWCDLTSAWLECRVPPAGRTKSLAVYASLNSVDFVPICADVQDCRFSFYSETKPLLSARSELACMTDQNQATSAGTILVQISPSLQSSGAVLACQVSLANAGACSSPAGGGPPRIETFGVAAPPTLPPAQHHKHTITVACYFLLTRTSPVLT